MAGVLRKYSSLALLLPAGVVYLGLFVLAAVYFFVISFWSVKSYKLVPGFSLANYVKTFATNMPSATTTLVIAFTIAFAATLIGFFYAWLIRFKAGNFAPALLFIAMISLFGGYLMKIYAWKTMLGGDGAVNSSLIWLGLVDKPVEALFYSPFAVVVSLTHFLLPFAILPIVSALRGIGQAEIESARDLGAGSWTIMRDITIPRSRTGIMAGFSLCFLIAVGDYLTPMLVGGKMAMFGQLISPQFGNFFNWPLGAAMSFSILFLSGIVLVLVYGLLLLVGRQP